MSKSFSSEFFALSAAGLNGTIGVLTKFGLDSTSHHAIAFWKCFGAFILLFSLAMYKPALRKQTKRLSIYWKQMALLSFLGVFCLYFFETWAFDEASIPLVSFLIYSSGIVTLLLSVFLLEEKMTWYKIIACGLIFIGIALLFLFEKDVSGSFLGIFLAMLGGLGYALFIFFSKYFNIPSGLPLLVWLFGFGSLYLFIPFQVSGFVSLGLNSWLVIIALILFPTIGGFYCTTKAVEGGEASRVQIIETTDPLFSALFAFFIFGEVLGGAGMIGATCIMLGLYCSMKK